MNSKAIITITEEADGININLNFEPEISGKNPTAAANIALQMLAAVSTEADFDTLKIKGKKKNEQ